MEIADLFALVDRYETDAEEHKTKTNYLRSVLEKGWNPTDDVSGLLQATSEVVRTVASALCEEEAEVYEGFADIFGYKEVLEAYPDLTKPFAYELEDPVDEEEHQGDTDKLDTNKLDTLSQTLFRVEGMLHATLVLGCLTLVTSVIALCLSHPNPF